MDELAQDKYKVPISIYHQCTRESTNNLITAVEDNTNTLGSF